MEYVEHPRNPPAVVSVERERKRTLQEGSGKIVQVSFHWRSTGGHTAEEQIMRWRIQTDRLGNTTHLSRSDAKDIVKAFRLMRRTVTIRRDWVGYPRPVFRSATIIISH